MKRYPALLLGLGLLCAGADGAQAPARPPEWQSLKIFQTVEPIFPLQLQQLSVTSGEARVVINVDGTGKLDEYLVVGYTMPEFADVAVRAIKQWKFEPAKLRGEPVGATVELSFHFESQGTLVVSQTVIDNLQARLLQLMPGAYAYRPCSLKDLDKIPTPIYTVSPIYPRELAEKGVKGKVVIGFYIDETGAVRMPAGSIEDNSELIALAIAALRQWRFEPPTRNGKPVLVAAQQTFNFGTGGGDQ
jgi:periplasmic protein TonB